MTAAPPVLRSPAERMACAVECFDMAVADNDLCMVLAMLDFIKTLEDVARLNALRAGGGQ